MNVSLQTANGKKKGQKSSSSKKKNSKTKNHSLRRSSKSGLGHSDLSAKLFTTMEKHKEVSKKPFTFCLLCKCSINCIAHNMATEMDKFFLSH